MFNIKKKLFTKRVRGTQGEIWDSELNIFIARRERDEARVMHDTAVNAIEMMKADPNNTKEQVETAEKQLEMVKLNMDEFDGILNGRPPSDDKEGHVGLTIRLENQIKRKGHLEAFIQQHC